MQLKLPPGTHVGRKIPKNKFYEKLQANSNLKELFVEQVESIVWAHKLARETIHLEPKNGIEEIQIFEIELRERKYSMDILRAIDRAIPYPILYVLKYEEEHKLAIAYKEKSGTNENRATVRSYHETDWISNRSDIAAFDLLQGLDLSAVYEHILRSLVLLDSSVEINHHTLSLEELLDRQAEIRGLEQDCLKLEAKIRKEKQFNRKVELNMQLQQKRKKWKALIHSGV